VATIEGRRARERTSYNQETLVPQPSMVVKSRMFCGGRSMAGRRQQVRSRNEGAGGSGLPRSAGRRLAFLSNALWWRETRTRRTSLYQLFPLRSCSILSRITPAGSHLTKAVSLLALVAAKTENLAILLAGYFVRDRRTHRGLYCELATVSQ
jgi:hypothetical protein